MSGYIDGGTGEDSIDLLGGTVDLDVLGGLESDTITLNGTVVSGKIDAGAGNDSITWQSGSVTEIHGGEGADVFIVAAAEYDNTQVLDGGDNNDEANGVVDRLFFQGLEIDVTLNNSLLNWEIIV